MDMRWIWAGIALVAVAGCDEVNFDDGPTLQERVAANSEMTDRVLDLPVTAEADMPTTGSVTYEGYAGILMETDEPTALVGDAEITAQFSDATLSGTLDNFEGRVNGGDAEDFDGTLTIEDGDIGIGTPSSFAAELSGDLTADGGEVLDVDGTIIGGFRGEDGPDALAAISVGGTDFTLDGEESTGTLTIVGER